MAITRSARLEADLLANGVGQRLEDSGVFQKNGFDPGKALGGFPPEVGHFPLVLEHSSLRFRDLGLSGGLSLNQKCLRLDERPQRLVKLVHLPVTFAATLGHTTAPLWERSFYLG